MSVLRNLEAKLGGLVEGAFGRAFKTNVQPVELAHKLAKEMEENQMVSVSRVYVPNHYRVFLSPADREQFASYEPALRKELSDYLLEHSRQERLALTSRPQVEFHTDERLDLGEFGIQAQLLSPPEEEAPIGARRAVGGRLRAHDGLLARRRVAAARAEGRPPPGAAGGRGQAQRAERPARGGRPQPRLRRGGERPERVAPPRGAPPRGRGLDGGRPRVHQRRQGERTARRALPASVRRSHHDRRHGPDLRARVGIPVDEPLAVALKFGFLAVLYLFLLWIARSSMRDLARLEGTAAAAEPRRGARAARRRSALPDLVGRGRPDARGGGGHGL